ncbi:uncharacterized protein LOC141592797 [Silene latifolia]|uniref:uncharacterized protein LOC141592797 n=1 Tax=Silene latifolia TaxID=37657 RepID=UPI003D77DFF6
MPSGAKKRKAAKKKLQKKVHNNNSSNKGSDSLSQGSDDPRSYDERDNGGVEVEREGNVEGGGVKNHDEEGAKEVRFVEGNGVRETKKGNNKSSSSSSGSSSSSSDNDEVEERSQEPESGNVEASIENSGASAVVNEAVEESIPLEESVKEVVSLPQASTIVSENVIESGLNQNVEEILQPLDGKIDVPSKMENIVEKVIPVVDRRAENISELVSVTVRHDEGLLPQSSGVKDVEGCCANDDCKASETHKYAEQQPLLSSAPITVRRTSWMDCCGLFEVFSGGSSR